TVKNPDRGAPNDVRILFWKVGVMPALRSIRPEDAAAHRNNGSKRMRPVFSNLPGPISTHRKTRQIEPLSIAMELFHAGGQSVHRYLHHVRIGPVVMLKRYLRHYHNKRPAIWMRTNGCR